MEEFWVRGMNRKLRQVDYQQNNFLLTMEMNGRSK